jgi:hypothetical protein
MKVRILFDSKTLSFHFLSSRIIYKTSTCNEQGAVLVCVLCIMWLRAEERHVQDCLTVCWVKTVPVLGNKGCVFRLKQGGSAVNAAMPAVVRNCPSDVTMRVVGILFLPWHFLSDICSLYFPAQEKPRKLLELLCYVRILKLLLVA